MFNPNKAFKIAAVGVMTFTLMATSVAPSAFADPPRFAPAHGYRDKHVERHDHRGHGHRHKYKNKHRHKHKHYRDHRRGRHGHRHYRDRRHGGTRLQFHFHNGHRHYGNPGHGHHSRPYYYRSGGYHADGGLIGGVVGAVVGGVAGSHVGKGSGRTAAIIGGSVLGAVVGGNLGRSMDRHDHYQVSRALETAPTGNSVTWRNPDTGTRYEVTPTETYQTGENRYCREYTTKGTIGGKRERVYGTACRMADGSWQLAD